MAFISRGIKDFKESIKEFNANSGLIQKSFTSEYQKTPLRLKIIDAFLGYAFLTTAIQFLYMLCVGTFPFNSFLSGFFCSLGFFVLLVSLRMQVDPRSTEFAGLLPQRAFADFCFCACLLFLVTWNFMG